jgi:hypothetical protein
MHKYGESKTTWSMTATVGTSLPERDVRNFRPLDLCWTVYKSPANFSGDFGWRVHHLKRFESSCLQNALFKISISGVKQPPPPPLSAPLWRPISFWANVTWFSHVRQDLAIMYGLVYHACYMLRPSHPNIQWTAQSRSSSSCNFLHQYVTWSLLAPNIPLNTLFSNTFSLRFPSMWRTKFHTHT